MTGRAIVIGACAGILLVAFFRWYVGVLLAERDRARECFTRGGVIADTLSYGPCVKPNGVVVIPLESDR